MALIPTACLVAACGGPTDAGRTASVRDSAGIRIVESSPHVAAAATLAAAPDIDIGGGDDPLYQFDYIGNARQLPDGSVVVGDERARHLRFYDAGGRYVRTQGGPGEGPGEYTWLLMPHTWSADTIVVFDLNQWRLTFVAASGEVAGIEAFSPAAGSAWPKHRLVDGRWLTEGSTAGVRLGDPEGMIRNRVLLIARTSDGAAVDTLIELEGGWLYRWWLTERQPVITPVPLTVQPSIAVTPDGDIMAASGVQPEVRRYAANGTLEAIYRILADPTPLNRAAFDSIAEAESSNWRERAPDARRIFGRMDVPTHQPWFDAVQVGTDGRIWARRFVPHHQAARSWIVFDTTGAALGTLDMPARFDVFEFGADYVLGRWRDDLDVQHLRLHRLVPAGS